MMLQRVKDFCEKVDTGGSWQKLKDEIDALTDDESERTELLTLRVIADLQAFFAKSSKKAKEKSMIQEKGKEKEGKYYSMKQQQKEGTKNEKKGKEKDGNYSMKQQQQKGTKNEKKGIKRSVYNHEWRERSEEEDDEEYMVMMRAKQKKQKRKLDDQVAGFAAMGLEPPPNMPQAFQNHIENLGGTEIKLVSQKVIYPTDVRRGENRLPISMKKVRNKFLSEAEEEEISKNNKSKDKKGMEAVLVEPCLQTSKINLTKWVIGGSPSYILNSQWGQVVEDNADTLKKGAVVQIWSFRIRPDSRLGFAIIKVGDMEENRA